MRSGDKPSSLLLADKLRLIACIPDVAVNRFVVICFVYLNFLLLFFFVLKNKENFTQNGPAYCCVTTFEGRNVSRLFRQCCINGTLCIVKAGNTKGGIIIVPLTSCLTGLESAV